LRPLRFPCRRPLRLPRSRDRCETARRMTVQRDRCVFQRSATVSTSASPPSFFSSARVHPRPLRMPRAAKPNPRQMFLKICFDRCSVSFSVPLSAPFFGPVFGSLRRGPLVWSPSPLGWPPPKRIVKAWPPCGDRPGVAGMAARTLLRQPSLSHRGNVWSSTVGVCGQVIQTVLMPSLLSRRFSVRHSYKMWSDLHLQYLRLPLGRHAERFGLTGG